MLKQEDKVTTKCNTSQLTKGTKLSRVSYMTVVYAEPHSISVRNEQGNEWSIAAGIVANECFTADQFNVERIITRTDLIDLFKNIGEAVFTVNFNKQPKIEDAFDSVANTGKLKTNAEIKKALVKAMKGEERTLVGYVIRTDVGWGRSMVVDMEQESKTDNIRQVDHRTINWLICRNIKYTVK